MAAKTIRVEKQGTTNNLEDLFKKLTTAARRNYFWRCSHANLGTYFNRGVKGDHWLNNVNHHQKNGALVTI